MLMGSFPVHAIRLRVGRALFRGPKSPFTDVPPDCSFRILDSSLVEFGFGGFWICLLCFLTTRCVGALETLITWRPRDIRRDLSLRLQFHVGLISLNGPNDFFVDHLRYVCALIRALDIATLSRLFLLRVKHLMHKIGRSHSRWETDVHCACIGISFINRGPALIVQNQIDVIDLQDIERPLALGRLLQQVNDGLGQL